MLGLHRTAWGLAALLTLASGCGRLGFELVGSEGLRGPDDEAAEGDARDDDDEAASDGEEPTDGEEPSDGEEPIDGGLPGDDDGLGGDRDAEVAEGDAPDAGRCDDPDTYGRGGGCDDGGWTWGGGGWGGGGGGWGGGGGGGGGGWGGGR